MSDDTANPPVFYARLADGSMAVGPLLRDLIAIQALNGLVGLSGGIVFGDQFEYHADQAYMYADAMLARRRR